MSCEKIPSLDPEPVVLQSIIQGEDYSYDVEVTEIPEGQPERPIDLTGAVFRAQLRKTPKSTEVLANFTPSVTDAENGKVSFSLSHDQTALIPATPCESGWSHDVFVDLADGRTLCIVPLTYLSVIPANSRATA